MRDYWLSKLFFDLQAPVLGQEFRADRARVLDRYPLDPEVRRAVLENDVVALAPRVNPYLLRFFFVVAGMPDKEFIRRLRTMDKREAAHG